MSDQSQILVSSGAALMGVGQSILVVYPNYNAYYVAGPSAISGRFRISLPVQASLYQLYGNNNLILNGVRARLLVPGQFGYAPSLKHNAGNAATLENAVALQAKTGRLYNLNYDFSGPRFQQNRVTVANGNIIRADISGNRYSLLQGKTVILAESKGQAYLRARDNQSSRLMRV